MQYTIERGALLRKPGVRVDVCHARGVLLWKLGVVGRFCIILPTIELQLMFLPT